MAAKKLNFYTKKGLNFSQKYKIQIFVKNAQFFIKIFVKNPKIQLFVKNSIFFYGFSIVVQPNQDVQLINRLQLAKYANNPHHNFLNFCRG